MIILHALAAKAKKPVAAYGSRFFWSKPPSHRDNQEDGRLIYNTKPITAGRAQPHLAARCASEYRAESRLILLT
jgi:hypothetical protein